MSLKYSYLSLKRHSSFIRQKFKCCESDMVLKSLEFTSINYDLIKPLKAENSINFLTQFIEQH